MEDNSFAKRFKIGGIAFIALLSLFIVWAYKDSKATSRAYEESSFSSSGIIESIKETHREGTWSAETEFYLIVNGKQYQVNEDLAENIERGLHIEFSGHEGKIDTLTFEK